MNINLMELAQTFGFPALIVLLLLIDRKQLEKKRTEENAKLEKRRAEEYERLTGRLSKVEDYVREELTVTLRTNAQLLERATIAIEKHEKRAEK